MAQSFLTLGKLPFRMNHVGQHVVNLKPKQYTLNNNILTHALVVSCHIEKCMQPISKTLPNLHRAPLQDPVLNKQTKKTDAMSWSFRTLPEFMPHIYPSTAVLRGGTFRRDLILMNKMSDNTKGWRNCLSPSCPSVFHMETHRNVHAWSKKQHL